MRFIINLALKTLVIVFLNWIGWITLKSDGIPIENDPKKLISTALIVAVIFLVVSILLLLFTFGFAALLMIFLGGAVLGIVGEVAPDFISLSSFWYTVVGGFLVMIVSVPKRTQAAQTSVAA